MTIILQKHMQSYIKLSLTHDEYMNTVKRKSIFKLSVMSNFKQAHLATVRGQGPGFLTKDALRSHAGVNEQRRFR